MSVVIQNITEKPSATGPHRYALRINHKVIAYFEHNREDGLAECLRKAAVAATNPRRQEILDNEALLDACLMAATSTTRKT